jgi:hypothetical protein
LTLPNEQSLAIPGYKRGTFGKDFREIKKIAEGGFGAIYLGNIINQEIWGSSDCIIKKSKIPIPEKVFFQELSI